MTKLEAVLREWNGLKTKFSQLKAKSIDNYLIMNKRTLLGLHNSRLNQPPVELYDILVEGGIVTKKKKTNLKSNRVVNIHTELLKVAIIEVLAEDFLTNYDESQTNSSTPIIPPLLRQPTGDEDWPMIEEVD